MRPSQRSLFFQALAEAFPNPETELAYTNTYTLLVAVVLSAQSTDKGVNKATAELFQHIHTPQDMVVYGEEALKHAIRSLGLYTTKAAHIIKLSHMLIDQFQGQVPSTLEHLMQLPGVGRKTANVVLNVAFGQPTIPVDTHVFRVSNRTGLAPGPTVTAVEATLLKVVPAPFLGTAHHLLILLGRYICKARKPECATCPVQNYCDYGADGLAVKKNV